MSLDLSRRQGLRRVSGDSSPLLGRGDGGEVAVDPLAQYQRIVIWAMMALLGTILLASLPVMAQAATQPITFDMVNKIAHELYCPVCPNETLDVCQTEACAQWRDEIHDQLAQGQSEQQIIDSFVRRYGQRVLGTPQDPTLRLLSLATPFLIAGLGLLIGIFTFMRWRGRPRSDTAPTAPPSPESEAYRNQLEQDLRD